jgi:hypothetical protein
MNLTLEEVTEAVRDAVVRLEDPIVASLHVNRGLPNRWIAFVEILFEENDSTPGRSPST